MDDTEKLIILADYLSDRMWGGERGWEKVDWDEFMRAVKEYCRRKDNEQS